MRFFCKLSTIVLACLLPLAVRSQYRFDQLTADNGLPQNSVYSIVQSPDGYIWMSTLDGLVRYDGVRFTVFNRSNSKDLPSNRLFSLQLDDQGSLWITTESGALVRYRDGQFRTFTINDGLPGDYVYRVMKGPDGRVMAFTRESAARFDGERFIELPQYGPQYYDLSLYVSPAGTLWEIRGRTLKRIRDGNETVFDLPVNPRDHILRSFRYDDAMRFYEDRKGRLWIYIGPDQSYKLDNGTIAKVNTAGIEEEQVFSISQDATGDIWFGTQKKGACRSSGGTDAFVCFGTEKGLSSNFVRKMMVDREGTFWIATHDRGVNRLSNQVVTPLSVAQGLRSKNVYSILEDSQGSIWISSFGSLSRFREGTLANYGLQEGIRYTDLQGLFEDSEKRLWIGGVPGIQYYKDGIFTDMYSTVFPDEKPFALPVYDIDQDDDGTLLFATLFGLYKYNGTISQKLTTDNGLPGNDVKNILKARSGGFWIGTYGGLAYMTADKIVAYTEKEGLAGNQVRALYEDETGTLWIGTYDSGLSRFKDGTFTNYTKETGLFTNGVFTILPDDNDNFWISSNQGIYRVNRKELDEMADGKRKFVTSTAFGKSDGMLNTEANGGAQPAGLRTRDGKLWFSTQDGVAVVDPTAVKFNPQAPPVVIEESRVDNQPFKMAQNEIKLEAGRQNLEIDYTGLSFIKPEQMRFRYRLEGLDDGWVEAGTRRTAFYPYIAPGTYTFQVIAANSDNVWNETGATVKVIVLPPFYRTWWFTVAALLIITIGIVATVRRRFSQVEKRRAAQQAFSRQLIASQEQERKRIAAELHDSLGQRLVVIKNLALMYLNTKAAATPDESQIEGISAEASHAIGEVKEISYNLRPYQLDRIGLTKAVEAIVRSAETASHIQFSTEIDNIDHYFPKETEINFYRIVQECVGNLVKHSEAKEAWLNITRSEDILDLTLRDNGRGFVPGQTESKTGGFGLIGIAERVELFGGSLELKSAPGKGTSLHIHMNSRRFPKNNP